LPGVKPIFLGRTRLPLVQPRTRLDLSHLTGRERTCLTHLAKAAQAIDSVFWMQKSEHGLAIRGFAESLLRYSRGETRRAIQEYLNHLCANKSPFYYLDRERKLIPAFSRADVRRTIARAPERVRARLGGDFSRLEEALFSPTVDAVRPPGANIYPRDASEAELAAFKQKASKAVAKAVGHVHTVLVRSERGFKAVPYHVHYREQLEEVAQHLERALEFADNRTLRRHLRAKIRVLREGFTGNYDPSDFSWLKLNSNIGVVFGQGVETYLDGVLGVKGAATGVVYVKQPPSEMTRRLQRIRRLAPLLEATLPCDKAYKNKKPVVPPVELAQMACVGGFGHGPFTYKAFNLPNDPRHGYKVVLLSNIEETKGRYRLMPIARRVLHASVLEQFSEDEVLSGIASWTLTHEFSHGHGKYRRGSREEAHKILGRAWNPIEEAKADIVGLHDLDVLAREGVVPERERDAVYAAGMIKWVERIQSGIGGAHSKASAVILNYLLENGAIVRKQNGRYSVDSLRWRQAIESLGKELLTIEGEADRKKASTLLERYVRLTPELERMRRLVRDVPEIVPKLALSA